MAGWLVARKGYSWVSNKAVDWAWTMAVCLVYATAVHWVAM